MTCQFCDTEMILVSDSDLDDDHHTGDARKSVTFSCMCSAWSGGIWRVNVHSPENVMREKA